jgi:hypothetical protein
LADFITIIVGFKFSVHTGIAPSIGEVPSSSERAAYIALTPRTSTIENRGQLLSFSFAVAPNRTMSL